MLNRIKTILAPHIRAARQSLNWLYDTPWLTLMTSIVIAITLSLPALFWVFSDNLSHVSASWQRGGHVSLYLNVGLSEAEEQAVMQNVRDMDGVAQVVLKSPAEGLAELTQQEGMHDIMNYLSENPLPAVLDVTPAAGIDSLNKLEQLAQQLQSITQVERVKVDREWISRLHAILGFVVQFAQALLILLALAVIVIIGTTLRLALHHRQEEIQVFKLIGAKDSFILRPFLYSGIWYGAMGALFAIFLVNLFILSLRTALMELFVVYKMDLPSCWLSIRQNLLLVLFAIILGWISARLSVKRQLVAIEPQL